MVAMAYCVGRMYVLLLPMVGEQNVSRRGAVSILNEKGQMTIDSNAMIIIID